MNENPLGLALKVIGWIIMIGVVVKASIIGYYQHELPAILIATAVGTGVLWLGSRADGWNHS